MRIPANTSCAIMTAVLLLSASCRNDSFSPSADPETKTVSETTSDSFKLEGTYSFNSKKAMKGAKSGFFLGTEPGITELKHDTIVGLAGVNTAEGEFEHVFMNIDKKNERIYQVGTKVYCRSFVRNSETVYLGEEISFTVPEAEYTVMVYGIGGGNLDGDIAYKTLVPMMLAGRDGKVEVTFQFKPSSEWQKDNEMKMKGVHRWVMPYEGEFAKIWDDKAVQYDEEDEGPYVRYAYGKFAKYSKKNGEKDLNMSDPQNLADFIGWSMEKCPAKNYILLMLDHGAGWDYYLDGSSCAETKSQFSDDNLDYMRTSLIDFIAGIKASPVGRLSAVLMAECLMGTVENIAEVSTVADCAMGSAEIVYGMRGGIFMEAVKNGTVSGAQPFSFLSDYADKYCESYEKYYTDCGIYDLTKIGPLFSAVKETTEFLCGRYEENAYWRDFVGAGVTGAVCVHYLENQDSRIYIKEIHDEVARWDELSSWDQNRLLRQIAEYSRKGSYEYCLYDFFAQTAAEAEKFRGSELYEGLDADIDRMQELFTAYKDALHATAHIACTKAQTAETPYEYTSLCVSLQSLNEDYYKPITIKCLYGYKYYSQVPLETAISTYNALEFDKKTSWSSLLKKLTISATFFFNADRQYRQTGE